MILLSRIMLAYIIANAAIGLATQLRVSICRYSSIDVFLDGVFFRFEKENL